MIEIFKNAKYESGGKVRSTDIFVFRMPTTLNEDAFLIARIIQYNNYPDVVQIPFFPSTFSITNILPRPPQYPEYFILYYFRQS